VEANAIDLQLDRPHSARMYDYYLGGRTNFTADREAVGKVMAAFPSALVAARANRDFMHRSTRFLAETGIDQFLDVGTGIPTSPNLHEVAQSVSPAARIVYVDNDPIVLQHAGALLTCAPPGRCAYLEADVRDPDRVLAEAAATLDLSEPVAVMMLGLLHFIPDADAPCSLTRHYLDALVPGSYLAVSHASSDIDTEPQEAAVKRYNSHSATPIILRPKAEVARFFDGLELVPPGITPLGQWAPGATMPGPASLPTYTALARKTT
jgi:hypothetical protein